MRARLVELRPLRANQGYRDHTRMARATCPQEDFGGQGQRLSRAKVLVMLLIRVSRSDAGKPMPADAGARGNGLWSLDDHLA